MGKTKHVDAIPQEFSSYEEAAEFWDSHDTMDYPESLTDVDVTAELRARHFEIEIEQDVLQALRRKAREKGLPVSSLASDLLRQALTRSA